MVTNEGGSCNTCAAGISFVFHSSLKSPDDDLIGLYRLFNEVYVDAFFFKVLARPYLGSFFLNIQVHYISNEFDIMGRACI